jgi:acyl carrier protein
VTVGDSSVRLARQEVLERLVPLLPVAPAERVSEALGLLGRGIGLDSIEVLALVSAIEAEFGLTIDDADLTVEHFRTLGTLVTFVESRL